MKIAHKQKFVRQEHVYRILLFGENVIKIKNAKEDIVSLLNVLKTNNVMLIRLVLKVYANKSVKNQAAF
jgi:hypothetical protein